MCLILRAIFSNFPCIAHGFCYNGVLNFQCLVWFWCINTSILCFPDLVKGLREGANEDIWERRVPAPPGSDTGTAGRSAPRAHNRNKVPIHRKAISNSTASRPIAARTLPKNPPPHPYNTISTPHRLVDPREDPPTGILRRSASKDSVRPNQAHILSRSLCDLDCSPVANNVQTKVANGPTSTMNGPSSAVESLPLAPKVPPYPPPRTESNYCNTFGRNGPLSSLSRLDESRDEAEPKGAGFPLPRSERKAVLTRMDTVV